MVTLGKKACLAKVVKSATIECVKEMLPDYRGGGIVEQGLQDNLATCGSDHQMCMWYQHRLCKKDLKYGNPPGDARQVRIRPGSHQPRPLLGGRDNRPAHQGGCRPVPGQAAQRADEPPLGRGALRVGGLRA